MTTTATMTEFDSYQKGYLDGRHDEMALSAALLLQERKLYEELEERLRDAEALTEFWKMEHKPWGLSAAPCPIGHDHTDNELYEYDPGLHREMHLAWNEEE